MVCSHPGQNPDSVHLVKRTNEASDQQRDTSTRQSRIEQSIKRLRDCGKVRLEPFSNATGHGFSYLFMLLFRGFIQNSQVSLPTTKIEPLLDKKSIFLKQDPLPSGFQIDASMPIIIVVERH